MLSSDGSHISLSTCQLIGFFDSALHAMREKNPEFLKEAFSSCGLFLPSLDMITRECDVGATSGSYNTNIETDSSHRTERFAGTRAEIERAMEREEPPASPASLQHALQCVNAYERIDPRQLVVTRVRRQANPAAHRSALRYNGHQALPMSS